MDTPRENGIKEKGAALRLRLFDKWQHFREAMRHKRRVVVMDTDTFKESFSFELTGTNLFVAVGGIGLALVVVTALLIAFTPLRGIIPGYVNPDMVEQTYRNAQTIDSLENVIAAQEQMITNIQNVISGEDMSSFSQPEPDTTTDTEITYTHSKADRDLRREFERGRFHNNNH